MITRLMLALSLGLMSSVAEATDIECGTYLRGGTPSVQAQYHLTRPLWCTGPVGIRLAQSYTTLTCDEGARIHMVGDGIGIRVGGVASNLTQGQVVDQCAADGGDVGIKVAYAVKTLIRGGGGSGPPIYKNDIGVYITNTNYTSLHDVRAVDNAETGILVRYSYRPRVTGARVRRNHGEGIIFSNVLGGFIGSPKALENEGSDILFTGPRPDAPTSESYINSGEIGILEFEFAHHNQWCSHVKTVINAGQANWAVCRPFWLGGETR